MLHSVLKDSATKGNCCVKFLLIYLKVDDKRLVLVYFPSDNTTSIVKIGCVIPVDDSLVIGGQCQVKERRKVYKGEILGIDKYWNNYYDT